MLCPPIRNQEPELATLAEKYIFAIPNFHCWGYKSSCRQKYGGKSMDDCGLMDGMRIRDLYHIVKIYSFET